jgi:hypothetical protein
MAYNQTDILTTLAYLMGETTVSSSTTSTRGDFIQDTIREAYAAHPWRFARANATLTISSGIATLPTTYDDSHAAFFKYADGSEFRIDTISPSDSVDVEDGDRAAWIETLSDGTTYVFRTKDTNYTTVAMRYQTVAPTVNASIATPYPDKMTLALGARRFVKLGQNPDADISQDEAIFAKRLAANIATHQVPAPRKRRRTRQSQAGSSTGDF